MSKNVVRASVPFTAISSVILANAVGVSIEEKSAWVKVSGPRGNKGPRIYIQRKENVRQVDLSGMGVPEGCVPSDGDNGTVSAHLDLSSDGWEAALVACIAIVAGSSPAAPAPKPGRPSLFTSSTAPTGLTSTGDSSPESVVEAVARASDDPTALPEEYEAEDGRGKYA